MDNEFVPYLCGGVLFSFLIELHKNSSEAFYGDTYGTKKVISQHEIMEKLIHAIYPDYNYNVTANFNTFKKTTSEYRTCKTNGGNVLPFECDYIRTAFNECVRNQYREVLERMIQFTSECFPTCSNTAMCSLVAKTLSLLRDDSSINDDSLFFINPNGFPISKKDLLTKEDFNFQSFLIGIWHYIITTPTRNENGRQTFEKLFPKCNDKKRKLDSRCIEPYAHNINLIEIEASKISLSEENYEYENIIEPPKTEQKEKLYVKIYYRGSFLQSADEKAILSNDPTIIDLNKKPDTLFNNHPNSIIYKITAAFQFNRFFLSRDEEIIRLSYSINSSNISGTTSIEKWVSRSKINEMCVRGKYPCTAWFTLTFLGENKYSAEFLMIGSKI